MKPDPFTLFSTWYEEALCHATTSPDIAALATADRHAKPACRMVFYRGIREGGFSFFTNYESRKGVELSENPFAAMVFYWPEIKKQVRIEGSAERLSEQESDAYFRQRPLESQITAAASRQSRPMPDETEFAGRLTQVEQAAKGQSILRPPDWGGFKLVPGRFEFWKQGEHRRHWRVLFEKEGAAWKESRLYP
jgi:pyridoxamine 5'-phosphate oxidase